MGKLIFTGVIRYTWKISSMDPYDEYKALIGNIFGRFFDEHIRHRTVAFLSAALLVFGYFWAKAFVFGPLKEEVPTLQFWAYSSLIGALIFPLYSFIIIYLMVQFHKGAQELLLIFLSRRLKRPNKNVKAFVIRFRKLKILKIRGIKPLKTCGFYYSLASLF